jgi:protein SERAC1
MWLEDSLPLDLQTPARVPNLGPARILIYGYDTHIENSQSFQTIKDLASQLRMSLRAIRRVSAASEKETLKPVGCTYFTRETRVCGP